MAWEPPVEKAYVVEATPLLSATALATVVPSTTKLTVPVGAGSPETPVVVPVIVTVCPTVGLEGEKLRFAVAVALLAIEPKDCDRLKLLIDPRPVA